MKHIWSIACLRSITDAETNSMSLINFVEQFRIPKKVLDDKKNDLNLITIHISFEIVNYLLLENRDEEKFELQIELVGPNNKIIKENTLTQKLKIKKPHKKIRARMFVNGISIQAEGRYHYSVKLKNQEDKHFVEVSQIPIDIKFE